MVATLSFYILIVLARRGGKASEVENYLISGYKIRVINTDIKLDINFQ